MWVRLLAVSLLASCYSPHAQPGAPCSPAAPACPDGQHCVLVGGGYECTTGSGDVADAPRIDAAIDARGVMPDARPDAAPLVPWTLVQTTEATSAAVNMAATGAGHTILVGVETRASTSVTAIIDDAGNTYARIPNARASNTANDLGIELWAARSSVAGATRIMIAAPTVRSAVTWEVAGLRATNDVDAATAISDEAASTTPVGPPITTTATGDFVVSIAIVQNVISALHAGSEFTNDHTVLGDGWAHLTSKTSAPGTHQATWDQGTAGGACAVSVALFVGP